MPNTCDTTNPACDQNKCDSVFEQVVVSWINRGGTSVFWELRTDFFDEGPYTFQLQWGETGNNNATDWENVGAPVVDVFSVVDTDQRNTAMVRYAHYRVKLTTSKGTYYSDPTRYDGTLDPECRRYLGYQYWQEQIKFRRDKRAQLGLLLKRRISGEVCPRCTSAQTDDVKDPQCTVCMGTGFRCGYYYPIGCVWARIDPESAEVDIDADVKGPHSEIVVKGEMLMIPMITSYDVWVNLRNDDRYYLHRIKHIKEIRGVPVLGDVEFRKASVSDVIYALNIPQQADYAELLGTE